MDHQTIDMCNRNHLHESTAEAEACNRLSLPVIPGALRPPTHVHPLPAVSTADAWVHVAASVITLALVFLSVAIALWTR